MKNRMRNAILVLVPLAMLAGACSTGDPGEVAFSGDLPEVELVELSGDTSGSIIPELVPKAELAPADADEQHLSYAPDVPPPIERSDQRVFDVHLEVLEGVCPLDPENNVSFDMWGYRVEGDDEVVCGSPGPILRGRVGDLARITLTNLLDNNNPHNIDFHAVTGQGGGAADLTVAPGETATIEVRLLYPGAFMYHCAFGDVPEHIAHGMYGMFIVDPEEPLPEAEHEWAVMQSEWYVTEPDETGLVELDRDAMFAEEPSFVTFNGRTDALVGDNALRMQVGERARIYMVNEGLNLDSNWHPIGSHWDTVYPEAATHPVNNVIRGSQSTLVVAGGGTVTELIGQVPSTIILVDHALVRTFYKGAIGQVIVEGEANEEIFSTGVSTAGEEVAAEPAEGGDDGAAEEAEAPPAASDEPVETDEVAITEGAWDPENAATAYSPPVIRVTQGTTVTWSNADSVLHTVTAGTSDGRVGDPSGEFDSSDMLAGDTFSFTFDDVGEFPYYCVPHPWMTGLVIVEAA
ncbi:MAG: plastocyanin/azurin family copper-binding protein [Acidimicrobiia bacterium]|nr:plastocyanin/azurin family copper-binding protein [Acidimicrobiia bacterium]